MNRYLWLVCWVWPLLLGLTGCGPQAAPSEALNLSAAPPPHRLRLPLSGALDTLDPGRTADTLSTELVEQLFVGLTDFDSETLAVTPELATHWEVEDGGRRYRFHLREDARWSDGTPLVAGDLVWALRRNLRADTAAPYAHMLDVLENAAPLRAGESDDLSQLGVEAIDDHTVEFRLVAPTPFFPAMVAVSVYRPLPAKVIEAQGDDWTLPQHIVTSGAYILSQWKRRGQLLLKRNPQYYGADQVAIDEVQYLVVPESSVGLQLYRNEALDLLGAAYLALPAESMSDILADPVLAAEYHNPPNLCTYYLGFNNQRFPTDNPLVRKALSAAVDRRLLVDVVTRGGEEPARTFTRPPIFGSVAADAGIGMGFDPEQAKRWLAEAGFPNGRGMPVLQLHINASETHRKVARAVQHFLRHYLNVQLEVVELEWSEFIASLDQPNTPHLFRSGWCADYPDANNWLAEVFHPTESANYIGWSNEDFAQRVEQARGSTDPALRLRLYREAERILCEEQAAIMPLFFHTAGYLVKPRVKGWYHNPMGGQHLRNWRLATAGSP